ncbi:hypothetical protein [Mariniblastus fucicola]|uniref:Uncharacterized protein n=1 Tax=Mariniblastus fucicola TaxID=980251 RepID=A0A5B9PHZ1_9BACT|nr:hypothetical protein [Mariniblastus fucicola]QEG24292.1 hypothetical protein MFFC18_42100 [Mariniblastus fucicola]
MSDAGNEFETHEEHEEDYEGFEKRDVQKMLLKSFMIVIFCYTLFMTGLAIIGSIVFYEAFQAAANLEPDAFTREIEENSALLFKRSRYLPFVALTSAFCFGLGWLIVRLAPFSRMVHAVILVLLVAATMFVFATGDNTPAEIQTVAMIMVAFGPIALVIGARIAVGGE